MGDKAYGFDGLDLLLKPFRSTASLLVDFPPVLKGFNVGKLRDYWSQSRSGGHKKKVTCVLLFLVTIFLFLITPQEEV